MVKDMKKIAFVCLVVLMVVLGACSYGGDTLLGEETEPSALVFEIGGVPEDIPVYAADIPQGNFFVEHFRRGINMGNMLEADYWGQWGIRYQPLYYSLIRERGFDFVRIPIAWSLNVDIDENGIVTPHEEFIKQVHLMVNDALINGLGAIINVHHFHEFNESPHEYAYVLYQFWEIMSDGFKDYPYNLLFSTLNEPLMPTEVWNPFQLEVIRIIRKNNPTRPIIVSGGNVNQIAGIWDLILPEDDNLILTFHYYEPFQFTHQGAEWVDGFDRHIGIKWLGTDEEKAIIRADFRSVKAWSETTGIPVFLGEFGVYRSADMECRVRYTQFVRDTAEKFGFAWAYWEFLAGFGIYDWRQNVFREELADALTGNTHRRKHVGFRRGQGCS